MSEVKEARTYLISGDLLPRQWSLLESTLGRIGVDIAVESEAADEASFRAIAEYREGVKPSPIEISTFSLTLAFFHSVAKSNNQFTTQGASRAWNTLALTYAYRLFAEKGTPPHMNVPDDFVNSPLEYEVVPIAEIESEWIYGYCRKLSGLKTESLARFMSLVESKIAETGKIESADLPEGLGKISIALIHAVLDASMSETD